VGGGNGLGLDGIRGGAAAVSHSRRRMDVAAPPAEPRCGRCSAPAFAHWRQALNPLLVVVAACPVRFCAALACRIVCEEVLESLDGMGE
jgi:hypothetical protein